ncbi:MAG: CBS domain-containing protein, partial [Pseudomonadota bacterium]
MLVHQILKSKSDDAVVTVPPGTTIAAAAKTLAERKIGTVVVSADGHKPDGILSERDIVRELAKRGGSILQDSV